MTLEELAKHWGKTLEETKKISDFMNAHYFLLVGKNRQDNLFYAMMYEVKEEDPSPRLAVSVNKGFKTSAEAARFVNDSIDTWEMPKLRADVLRVPKDAYKALHKLEVPSCIPHKAFNRIQVVGRGARSE